MHRVRSDRPCDRTRFTGILQTGLALALDDSSGSTAVEFAAVAPVLLLLIFGIVDVGLAMVSLEEFNGATSAALRQLRTGLVQQSPIPSTYAGSASCLDPNFTPSGSQNCIGFDITSSDTASTIFGKLICANSFDGGTIFKCSNDSTASTSLNWQITGYASWAAFNSAVPSLTYNPDGTPSATFCGGAGCPGSIPIAAMVGYKRSFFVPLVGCFFDPTDCKNGKTPILLLTYYSVFVGEPWGNSGVGS